jgi:hypothetical protein
MAWATAFKKKTVRPEPVEACPERLLQADRRGGLHFFKRAKKDLHRPAQPERVREVMELVGGRPPRDRPTTNTRTFAA